MLIILKASLWPRTRPERNLPDYYPHCGGNLNSLCNPSLSCDVSNCLTEVWKTAFALQSIASLQRACVFSSVWHSALFPSALWPGWPHRRLFLSQHWWRQRTPPPGLHHPNTPPFMHLHRCLQWLAAVFAHMLVSSWSGRYMIWKSKPIEICQHIQVLPFFLCATCHKVTENSF